MKKLISILLAVMLVASLVITASAYSVRDGKTVEQAVADYVAENGPVDTNRYYFMMPDGEHGMVGANGVAPSWYNEFTDGAGIYWWGGPAYADAWAGYAAMVEDEAEHVYYADVPTAVVTIVWNNGVDGGTDTTQDIYYKAAQTVDINAEFCLPGEIATLPDGVDSYDGCIFVINPDEISVNPLSEKQTCGGTWYHYYGNGCYGSVDGGSEEDCLNPDHDHGSSVAIGDVDGDGQVTILDATQIQRYKAEMTDFDATQLKAGDVDGDGQVTILDATRIQYYKAEMMNLDGSKPYVG